MSASTTPPKTGQPAPSRRSPGGPSRTVPGGPLATPDEEIKRKPHRRRRNVPTETEVKARAAKLDIPGLEIFPETAAKGKSSGQGRYLVETKCCSCGHEMPQVLTALEQGKRKKCSCQGGVRGHSNPIRYTLAIRYRAMVQRCHRTTHVSDANYRGRGIEVHFSSVDDFVSWALTNFPEQALSGFTGWDFDRIDNDGHYTKNNLRLVCRSFNLLNRRHSKKSHRAQADAFIENHPEVTYSVKTVNNLIQQGLSEVEILERHAKNAGTPRRPRSKNPKFRNTATILAGAHVIYPLSHSTDHTDEI